VVSTNTKAETADVDHRAMLEHERDVLIHQLAELGFAGVSDTGLSYDANFADTSQVTAERGEAESLATELRRSLDAVELAITRWDTGSFGICARCGNPISEARLEAKPAVTTCITCAQLQR